MPDDNSIQYLEEADRAGGHLVDLLNQADQALLQFRNSLTAFREAHELNNPPAAQVEEAIKDVEAALHHASDKHNDVVARLKEARNEVENRPQDDPGY